MVTGLSARVGAILCEWHRQDVVVQVGKHLLQHQKSRAECEIYKKVIILNPVLTRYPDTLLRAIVAEELAHIDCRTVKHGRRVWQRVEELLGGDAITAEVRNTLGRGFKLYHTRKTNQAAHRAQAANNKP